MTPNRFASLPLARAYIETVRAEIKSLGAPELIKALQNLHRAYQAFPELELDWPRRDLSEDLRSALSRVPDRLAIPLLRCVVAFDPTCLSCTMLLLEKIVESDDWGALLPILRSLNPSRSIHWNELEPIVTILYQREREDLTLPIFSELIELPDFSDKETAAGFGNILARWLSDQLPVGIDSGALAKAAQSARRALHQPALGSSRRGSGDALLAMAQRLRAAPPPQRAIPNPDLAWPSGGISFDEFLMQWPCEVELPIDLDDQAFIEEAYQAILLRGPYGVEKDQYLRLLQNGVVSKRWIIEDLLASQECRSFERRLRVNWGGCVITEPARPEAAEMPAVTWPWRSAT